jgi:PIN domain nuclease of toxin-antitoxin system
MASEFVLDAHALLWFFEGNPKLGLAAREAMSQADAQLVIPAIALAEVCRVVAKGRTTIPSMQQLLTSIDKEQRMVVEPIDRDLIGRSDGINGINEMHDQLIVATVLRRREKNSSVVLLCDDAQIRDSKLVSTTW